MSLKLTYFDFGGFAESIRYILYYRGKEFEDVRYDGNKWPIKEVKEGLPFGKMPLLEEDGRTLHQSIAIARYLVAGTELLPTDPWKQAVLDATVLTVYDLMKEMNFKETDPVKKEELKNKFLDVDCPFYLSRFEKQLKANNGYFVGELSWAEFVLTALIECLNQLLDVNLEQNYPRLKALMQKILSLPGVKEYVAKRKSSTNN